MNRAFSPLITIVVGTLLAAVTLAQQAVLTPVPILPKDGVLSADTSKSVFVDPSTSEIVISYLDASAPMGRRVARYSQHTQVAPIITSSILLIKGGGYRYDYIVANGSKAGGRMKNWSLSVASGDSGLNPSQSPWTLSTEPSQVARLGAIRPEVRLIWSDQSASNHVDPGGTLAGFSVSSKYLPGFVIASAQSMATAELTPLVMQAFPADVQTQLSLISNPHWDTVEALTIGPKYLASDPKSLIAADFYRGIKELIAHGVLKADSKFATAAIGSLEFFLQAPTGAPLQLPFLSIATPGIEAEIARALSIEFN